MDVVFVASEAVPFAKTGGLADVAGALPYALDRQGHRAVLFMPCHRRARAAGLELVDTDLTLHIPIGARVVDGRVLEARRPGSEVVAYLIDQPGYFDRDGLYGTRHDRLRRQLRAIRLLPARRARDRSGPCICGPTSSIATTGRPG